MKRALKSTIALITIGVVIRTIVKYVEFEIEFID